MKVGDRMDRAVSSVSPGDTIAHASRVMATLGVTTLSVAENGVLVGVVTSGDIVKRGLAAGLGVDVAVARVMTPMNAVVIATADDNVEDVLAAPRARRARRIPVVETGGFRLLGMLPVRDMLAATQGSGSQGAGVDPLLEGRGAEAEDPADPVRHMTHGAGSDDEMWCSTHGAGSDDPDGPADFPDRGRAKGGRMRFEDP